MGCLCLIGIGVAAKAPGELVGRQRAKIREVIGCCSRLQPPSAPATAFMSLFSMS
jgi:hypothetical protein